MQKELLKQHGHNVIAMDGTHDISGYDYLLQPMHVLDRENEGVAVAFSLSYQNDEKLIDAFLTCIKAEVGNIQPKTMMTDMQETYYNSWRKIMLLPTFQLYCTMACARSLAQKSEKKLKYKEKYKDVSKRLQEMSNESHEMLFKNKMDEFLSMENKDLETFV